jgi:hypothetical protein
MVTLPESEQPGKKKKASHNQNSKQPNKRTEAAIAHSVMGTGENEFPSAKEGQELPKLNIY